MNVMATHPQPQAAVGPAAARLGVSVPTKLLLVFVPLILIIT
jgi:hypothetical protein